MEKLKDENKPIDYFQAQKKNLVFAGISVSGNESLLYRIYVYFIYFLRATWVFLLMLEVFSQVQRHDLKKAMKPAIFLFGVGAEISKSFTFYLNRVKLGKAFDSLEAKLFAPNRPKWGSIELKWLEECNVLGKRQTAIGTFLANAAVTSMVISCYVKKLTTADYTKWDLPFGESTVIDTTYSPNYELVLLSQSIALYFGALSYISINVIMSYFFTQIATQCRILNHFIRQSSLRSSQKMIKDTDRTDSSLIEIESSQIPWKYLKQTLTEIVEYHTALISASNNFEDIFNKALLLEHLGILLAVCCAMYDGSLFPMTDPRVLQDGIIVTAVLSQIWTIGYYASKVISESELFGTACYESNFVGTDIRFQKGLIMMMQNGQKPITFTVGKFTPLTVTVSLAIVKTAISYFMVLRSTDGRGKDN